VVDLWYVPCVLVPLLASISAPAWFVALAHPRGPTIGAVLGLLAAGWIPWLVALMSTIALADKYEISRHPRSGSEADAWDQFAVRLLAATGALGVVLTLLWAGLILSVTTS
jgi:hypothetical protein